MKPARERERDAEDQEGDGDLGPEADREHVIFGTTRATSPKAASVTTVATISGRGELESGGEDARERVHGAGDQRVKVRVLEHRHELVRPREPLGS